MRSTMPGSSKICRRKPGEESDWRTRWTATSLHLGVAR
jgi:hypothetical protein